jgi:activator of 2-hydroxyglutaryl-CoA dehydratase
MKDQLTLIGGVARQAGIAKALEDRLKVKVDIPQDCDFVCALGAALLGLKRLASKGSTLEGAAREYAN